MPAWDSANFEDIQNLYNTFEKNRFTGVNASLIYITVGFQIFFFKVLIYSSQIARVLAPLLVYIFFIYRVNKSQNKRKKLKKIHDNTIANAI